MRIMPIVSLLVGLMLIAGEVARRGDSVLAAPRALDDLVAGAVLVMLGLLGRRLRPAWHAAGWALFTGVMLSTLGINLDGWLADAEKPRAGVYVPVLAALVLLGVGATIWWARRR